MCEQPGHSQQAAAVVPGVADVNPDASPGMQRDAPEQATQLPNVGLRISLVTYLTFAAAVVDLVVVGRRRHHAVDRLFEGGDQVPGISAQQPVAHRQGVVFGRGEDGRGAHGSRCRKPLAPSGLTRLALHVRDVEDLAGQRINSEVRQALHGPPTSFRPLAAMAVTCRAAYVLAIPTGHGVREVRCPVLDSSQLTADSRGWDTHRPRDVADAHSPGPQGQQLLAQLLGREMAPGDVPGLDVRDLLAIGQAGPDDHRKLRDPELHAGSVAVVTVQDVAVLVDEAALGRPAARRLPWASYSCPRAGASSGTRAAS